MVGELVEETRGRDTVMTPEIISKLEQAFLLGCSDLEACFFADIGKTTLYNYQKANPDFAERKEKLKQSPILAARQSVVDGFKEDAHLALKYLERKRKKEFGLRSSVDMTSGGEKLKSFSFNVRELVNADRPENTNN